MKRIVNIKKTFRALRQLPLAVSYEQVAAWVEDASVGNKYEQSSVNKNWWRSLLSHFFNN